MIHHVTLETRPADVDACVAFYALLGFERVDPPVTLRDRAAFLARGVQQVHLLHVDEPDVPSAGHLAIVPARFAATVGALRDAGHRVHERAAHWGAARVYAWDPAGHLVELMEFPPA